ncbi:response regulator [Corallococcus sp. AB049A]|uniref:Response regulator n=1 Tax=Corallococcus interemptor TaxID=2316720 RepID=A0A3A8Q9L7_9BACT|nr:MULTISPECIES: response regulator [Corallococcus]RKH53713.1 response regulator [Corallococcus sp. AB050B]RKH62905.1 response regulator [Corallococcus interemptor]RKI72478.1 response regulator [Corallococcus sp. AB049A]
MVHEQPEGVARNAAWEDPHGEPGRAPRILVADDQTEMRTLIRKMLVRRGYDVVEAADGPDLVRVLVEGLTAEESRAPDLIITDVRMPGFTGLEVLARLRREQWTTPVILITAFGDVQLHREALRLGAACVLNKPFDMDELRGAVEVALAATRE